MYYDLRNISACRVGRPWSTSFAVKKRGSQIAILEA